MSVITSPVFVDLSGYPSGITSVIPTKDPSPVPIMNWPSAPSETPTKIFPVCQSIFQVPSQETYRLNIEVDIQKVISATFQLPIQYQKPDAFKQGSQESQLSLQIIITLFILHIILSSPSSQRVILTYQKGSLRISHIRLHTVIMILLCFLQH